MKADFKPNKGKKTKKSRTNKPRTKRFDSPDYGFLINYDLINGYAVAGGNQCCLTLEQIVNKVEEDEHEQESYVFRRREQTREPAILKEVYGRFQCAENDNIINLRNIDWDAVFLKERYEREQNRDHDILGRILGIEHYYPGRLQRAEQDNGKGLREYINNVNLHGIDWDAVPHDRARGYLRHEPDDYYGLNNIHYLFGSKSVVSKLKSLYGNKIIEHLINRVKIKPKRIPLLPKDYVNQIKDLLTKKNAYDLIRLTEILSLQGVGPRDLNLETSKNKSLIKNLEEQIISNYPKKIKIKDPVRALKLYYKINNQEVKSLLEQIISDEYDPAERFYAEKTYTLKLDTHDEKLIIELDNLKNLLFESIDYLRSINDSYNPEVNVSSINEIKVSAKAILKKLGSIKQTQYSDLSNKGKVAVSGAGQLLHKILSYNSKFLEGDITIRLDSKEKVDQLNLCQSIPSCFEPILGSNKHYSLDYITTDRINFVGIYNGNGKAIGRFTLIIDPDNKRLGLSSRIYKRFDNKLASYVEDWVNELSEKTGYEIGGEIDLPVWKFYDDFATSSDGSITLKERYEETLDYL